MSNEPCNCGCNAPEVEKAERCDCGCGDHQDERAKEHSAS